MRMFYTPRQSVPDNASFSPSAGKPEAFVAAAAARFPGRLEIEGEFKGLSPKAIALAHDPAYVEGVLSLKRPNGFGNRLPQVAASLPWTTGSLYAAAKDAVLGGGTACSPTSGFHHAGWASGAGYCTFNGLIIAALLLKVEGLASRVAIVDLDMHWGNGSDEIIGRLGLDWVTNYSFGDFAEMLRLRRDIDGWLARLPEELDKIAGDCDLVIYQAGADPHVDDPLGGYLTTEQLRTRDRAVFSWASSRGMPIAWNLAGGYQQPLDKVLELHLATVEECLAAFEPAKG